MEHVADAVRCGLNSVGRGVSLSRFCGERGQHQAFFEHVGSRHSGGEVLVFLYHGALRNHVMLGIRSRRFKCAGFLT
jgi:hypothetical protein